MGIKSVSSILNYCASGFLALILLLSFTIEPILSWTGNDIQMNLVTANLSPTMANGFLGIFGTDALGKNLLPLIIYAGKYSLLISLLSALIATVIGVISGTVSGFFGDEKLQVKRATLTALVIVSAGFFFYINIIIQLYSDTSLIMYGLLMMVIVISNGVLINNILSKLKWMQTAIKIPVDLLNMKVVEILFAIPIYFVLLAVSSILQPSVYGLIVIIGCTSWPQTALLVRSEVLKIRSEHFLASLTLLGIKRFSIIYKHIIPITIRPAVVNMIFLISSLLIVESTLSFIGIGLPEKVISWGKILSGFRHDTSSWWVALFPGIVIFLTILSFHRLGNWVTGLLRVYK